MLILLCGILPARAADLSLQQFLHTRWTTRDGAPASVLSLAQTTDGVLWIGTPAGLYTFNGYEFRPFHPAGAEQFPSLDIPSLAEDGRGGLWVGFWYGGMAHINSDRSVVLYGAREGVHPGNVQQIASSKNGGSWAIAGNELIRFDGTRWHSFGPSEGDSTNNQHGVDSIFLEPSGAFWVMFGSRLYFVRPGGTSLEPTQERSYLVNALRRAPDGQLWLADEISGVRRACPQGCDHEAALDIPGVTSLLFDANGDLWASSHAGVHRIRPRLLGEGKLSGPAVERVTAAQGLTSDRATCLLRDREDNIWVGTSQGLDRFQRSAFAPFTYNSVLEAPSLVADARSTVWFGTYSSGMRSVQSESKASSPVAGSLPTNAPNGHMNLLLAPGAEDTLLVSRNEALLRYTSSRLRSLPALPLAQNFPIFAMAEDISQGLFVALVRNGTWRLWNGRWSPIGSGNRSNDTTPKSLCFDMHHRLWMGYPDGRVEVLDPVSGRSTRLPGSASLGAVLVIARNEGTMWMGGTSGVAWSDGAAVHALRVGNADALRGVSGIVEAADGSYWFNGAAGVIRVAAEEIHRAVTDPNYAVNTRTFNYEDGLEGVALQIGGRPTAVRDAAGRLWFSTTSGLFFIDPVHIPVNVVPPSVRVAGVQLDGRRLQESFGIITVPPGVHTVRIAYEAISLTSPDRVTHRYKLDGEDKEWQDAGVRREAVYTGMRPGIYTFHVMAANASGVWSGPEPMLSLRVKPSFYQTTWFRFFCFAAVGLLLWFAYLWRVRFVIARVEEKLNERARERVRIARDLHDTLLQGIQGLVLRFHFAAEQVPVDQPAHALLSQALNRADQVISEGRDRVKQLRGQPSSTDELLKALLESAESQRWDRPIEIRALAEGDTRPLPALVHDELYAIGREAVTNALRHASPTQIEIELISQASELRLRCRDNGVGMSADDPQRASGHWGILGMQERAARLGARFDLWSSPGAGTEIEVRVRAAAAYASQVEHRPGFSLARLFVHSEE